MCLAESISGGAFQRRPALKQMAIVAATRRKSNVLQVASDHVGDRRDFHRSLRIDPVLQVIEIIWFSELSLSDHGWNVFMSTL